MHALYITANSHSRCFPEWLVRARPLHTPPRPLNTHECLLFLPFKAGQGSCHADIQPTAILTFCCWVDFKGVLKYPLPPSVTVVSYCTTSTDYECFADRPPFCLIRPRERAAWSLALSYQANVHVWVNPRRRRENVQSPRRKPWAWIEPRTFFRWGNWAEQFSDQFG